MNLQNLLPAIEHLALYGITDRTITAVEYDSRKCDSDTLFVAIRGLSVDGHMFIPQAIERGAKVIVSEEPIDTALYESNNITNIVVKNSRIALAQCAHVWWGFPSKQVRVFGITGTNGKTTTTFVLKALLEALGETVGIIGTTGNYIGANMLPAAFTTPESPELCALLAEMKTQGATAIVMEVSSHALALERVHGVEFAGAIFTNLTQDHLDFHGTMEHYAAAKKLLFDMLPASAVAVVNDDDDYANFMVSNTQAAHILRFGRNEQAMVRITTEQLGLHETHFAAVLNSVLNLTPNSVQFTMNLVGRFNIDNAAAALTLCLGIQHQYAMQTSDFLSVLQSGLSRALPAPGRMHRIGLPSGAVAIVDYAHTPDALEKALLSCKELREAAGGGRIAAVFGCGGNRDRTKRPKMAAIGARLADTIVLTNDNPRKEDPQAILNDMLKGLSAEERTNAVIQLDRRAAITQAVRGAERGDIVLIAGKGHENYQIIGEEKLHFDDREIVQECVREDTQGLS